MHLKRMQFTLIVKCDWPIKHRSPSNMMVSLYKATQPYANDCTFDRNIILNVNKLV